MKKKLEKYAVSFVAAAVVISSIPSMTFAAEFGSGASSESSFGSSFEPISESAVIPDDGVLQDNDSKDQEVLDDSAMTGGVFFAGTEESPSQGSDTASTPDEAFSSDEAFSPAEASSSDVFEDGSSEVLFGDGENGGENVFEDGTEEEGVLGGALLGNGLPPEVLLSESGVSDNRNRQNYSTWSSPVKSYLAANASGYLRVEYVDSQVVIEQYNTELLLQSQRYIANELPYFGGFYEGSNAYYLVFGQSNTAESDSVEVIRVVKYDKNWNRLGAASLRGANTTYPFNAGSLRMTEYGGYLYIRTCHQMYKSQDGLNHQSNLTMQVRISDMAIVDSFYDVMNIVRGYVSHSFNQFIIVDDQGNIVALDHGDAYPRSAALGSYEKSAGGDSFTGYYYSDDIFGFQGNVGDNYTGASLGGLEYSGSSYLTAGNSVQQDAAWSSHSVRNIFITATPRSDCTKTPVKESLGGNWYSSISYPLTQKESTTVKWITNYAEGSGISASTPHLVKLGSNSFLLLWAQMEGYSANGKISYVFLDGMGNVTSSVYTKDGYLSDCKPVVSGETAVWYITDGKKLTFYKVKQDGSFETEVGHLHSYEPKMEFEKAEINCGLIEGSTKNTLTTNTDGTVTYSSSDTNIATVDASGKVSLKNLGTCTITASAAAGVNYGAKKVSYTLHVISLKKQTIQVAGSFTRTYGDKSFSLNASCSGGAKLSYSSDNKKVVTVSDKGKVSIIGNGSASITIIAAATSEYAGASTKVSIKINKKAIKDCRLIFTKVGPISSNSSEFSKYLAVADGDTVLKEGKDYETWGNRWWYSGNYLGSLNTTVVGIGNYTGEIALEVHPIAEKSVLNSAKETSKGIQLSWEKDGGAMGYCIYRKIGNGKFALVKKITNRDTVKWTDTEPATVKGAYTYCIKAYTKSGTKTNYAKKSAEKCVVTAPVLKSVTSAGYNKLKITWNKVEGASGYVVYQKIGGKWKKLKTTTGTSYTHTNSKTFPVQTGTANTYTIKAYYTVSNKPVYSSYSKTGISGKAVPGKPVISAVAKSGKGMKLTIKKVSGATGYEIQRNDGTKWVKIASTKKLSYGDAAASKKGTTYKYRVRAYRTVNGKNIYGSYSAVKSGIR